MKRLTDRIIKENLNYFLCSYGETDNTLLINEDFNPESFTVYDKMVGKDIIYFRDISFVDWCSGLIIDQLSKINIEIDKDLFVKEILYNINTLLNYKENGEILAKQIYNQEFVDIVRRVMFYTIYGKCDSDLDTAKSFNELAYRIVPDILHILEKKEYELKDIFLLSVASGMMGLDMKGSPAAASNYANQGIPMKKYINMESKDAAKEILKELEEIIDTSDTPVFYWEQFMDSIQKAQKIVWMTDDYIESFFDLFFIQKLLANYNLDVELIAKNGRFGNDLSWNDVETIIRLPVFSQLYRLVENKRIIVNQFGPQMGAANLRKLSKQCNKSIRDADFVVTKGCRIHEMIQGGINKRLFSSYIVTRELSQIVTGFNAKETPILLLLAEPGEYLFWGVNQGKYKKCWRDSLSRGIMCCSTIKMHEKRKSINNPKALFIERENIKKCLAHYNGDKRPLYQELLMLKSDNSLS